MLINTYPDVSLGLLRGRSLFVEERMTVERGEVVSCTLRFKVKQNGRQVSYKDFYVWESKPDIFKVSDFLRTGRKQVFVRAAYGASVAYFLEFDGVAVHKVYEQGQGRWYSNKSGRMRSFPMRDSKGRFCIHEEFGSGSKLVKGRTIQLALPVIVERLIYFKPNRIYYIRPKGYDPARSNLE